jgi:flagellar basal-body rod modification protein FlgD
MSFTTASTATNPFDALGLAREQAQGQTKRGDLGLNDFFKLMITQLKNQDPMKPMENGEFLSQIAQFGTVSGIDKLNKTFEGLAANLTSGQALQAGNLIGREVLVPGGVAALTPGAPLRGVVPLDASAADVVLHIYNGAGALVRDLSLGGHKAGDVRFSWDGMTNAGTYAPAGTYYVQGEAVSGDKAHAVDTQLYATVASVNLGDRGGLTLDLAGLGTVPFSAVREIH